MKLVFEEDQRWLHRGADGTVVELSADDAASMVYEGAYDGTLAMAADPETGVITLSHAPLP